MHFITTYKDNINEQCYYESLKGTKASKKKNHIQCLLMLESPSVVPNSSANFYLTHEQNPI